MKAITGNLYRNVRIVINTDRSDRPQFGMIWEGPVLLHKGQLPYIRRTAKTKYNLALDI